MFSIWHLSIAPQSSLPYIVLNYHRVLTIFSQIALDRDSNIRWLQHLPQRVLRSIKQNRWGRECSHISIAYDVTQIIEETDQILNAMSHGSNLLDLFLTSSPDKCWPEHLTSISKSDHSLVSFYIDYKPMISPVLTFYTTYLCEGRLEQFSILYQVSSNNLPWNSWFNHWMDSFWNAIFIQK